MRQGSNPKRPRGRNGRKNINPRSQSFESNGPEVKVRGNAQQVVEKYLALARDASTAGDRVAAESYFQHAEHYYRLMTANGGHEGRETQPRPQQPGDYDDRSQPAADGAMATAEKPESEAPAADDADDADGADGADGADDAEGAPPDPASAPQPETGSNRAA